MKYLYTKLQNMKNKEVFIVNEFVMTKIFVN